ncbi:MAG: glycerol-3-phosphate dehydrogenase [Hyphomicrobiales bacterium]|nr:glycerol-3-phosphate dehydrogenase [Hyphomicrobiales bacterium]
MATLRTGERGQIYDLLVVGGGVNGCGIARDAAGRGLKVLLVEADDLASATSSASTKLIHGGLRYLEFLEFRLVREALQERELLLSQAPHIIWPLRFVLPHDPNIRSALLVRIGLFIYDRLAGRRRLPPSSMIDVARHDFGEPLQKWVRRAFVYSDCWVDDSRLVSLLALDARERGAQILLRTALVSAERSRERWLATLRASDGSTRTVQARAIVNATGPWVADVLANTLKVATRSRIRLVKGSHIIVDRLHDGEQAYVFQNSDGRIVFVIPYEERFSLIGTTDEPFHGDPRSAAISRAEVEYLIASAARHLRVSLGPADVRHSYSGVRPLFDDGKAAPSRVTRDYVLELDQTAAPVLSVFGGKITTFRRLAEQALDELSPVFPDMRSAWTARATLPGGDLPGCDIAAFETRLQADYPFLGPAVARRLARSYGSRAHDFLGRAKCVEDLGEQFGHGFSAAELAYLRDIEAAQRVEDILWRRSKLGLHLEASAQARVAHALNRADELSSRDD